MQVYIHSMSLQVAGVSATVAEGHPRSSTEINVSLLVEGVSPAYSCRWTLEEVH